MLVIATLGFVFAAIFFVPDPAWAWGPATHMSLALAALDKLSALKPTLYALLNAHMADYLYGCLSSDILLGKRFARYQNHCHNWDVGRKLLKEATSPKQKAFALGYLSHLAADTVSHNLFVPSQIILNFASRTVRHLYWELRFDALMDDQLWQLAKEAIRRVHRDHDQLLRKTLAKTSIHFATGQQLLRGYLMLSRVNRWKRLIRSYSIKSNRELPAKSVADYYDSSLNAVVELLTLGQRASCLKLDPTGRLSLARAKQLRRTLRRSLRETNFGTIAGRGQPSIPTSAPASRPEDLSGPAKLGRPLFSNLHKSIKDRISHLLLS